MGVVSGVSNNSSAARNNAMMGSLYRVGAADSIGVEDNPKASCDVIASLAGNAGIAEVGGSMAATGNCA